MHAPRRQPLSKQESQLLARICEIYGTESTNTYRSWDFSNYTRKAVKELTVDDPTRPFQQCESGIQAKQHRQSFPKEAEHRSGQLGELTYSDVWGPARVVAIGGLT
jgi:hypothetical protein